MLGVRLVEATANVITLTRSKTRSYPMEALSARNSKTSVVTRIIASHLSSINRFRMAFKIN